MALWSLIPAVASTAYSIYQRSKLKPQKADTGYVDKYIAHLRGMSRRDEIQRKALEPQLRVIGRQATQAGRGIETQYARGGDEGLKTSAKLDLYSRTLTGLGEAGESAALMQAKADAGVREKIADLEIYKGRLKEQAHQEYEQQKQALDQQVVGSVAQLGTQALQLATTKPETQIPKMGEIKTAFDETGNQIEYQMIDGIATDVTTGTPVDWGQYQLEEKTPKIKQRILSKTEWKQLGYNPPPKGHQWQINENTGAVELVGKTPPKTSGTSEKSIDQILETTGKYTKESAEQLPVLIEELETDISALEKEGYDVEEKSQLYSLKTKLKGLQDAHNIDKITPRADELPVNFVVRLLEQNKTDEEIIALVERGFKKDQTRATALALIKKARKEMEKTITPLSNALSEFGL